MAQTKKRRSPITIPNATVYKTGSVQAIQGNTCRLFLSYKDEETGKWKSKNKTYRSENEKLTRKEATNALLVWAAELEEDLQTAAAAKKPTVAEYMRFYIDGRANKIERRTISEYDSLLKVHIAPKLGSYQIDELNPDIVQKWVNDCAKTHAPRTVRKALVLLRSAMQQAVDRDTLIKNPCRTVEAPKVPHVNPNALDEKGRAKVLQFIAIDPTSAANMGYSLALLMGMRQGEICGLKWRYVDLDNKTLDIVEALSHDNNATGANHWYTKEPKTASSRRTLSIPDQLIEPLKARLAEARESAFSFGMDYRDFYVIGFADGSPMNGNMLSTRWRTTATALELVGIQGERPTFHDLRHTWATKAVADGTDIKTVSSVLGHTNAAMTLNIYASADPAAKKQAAQNVANSMFAEAQKHAKDGEVLEYKPTGTEN